MPFTGTEDVSHSPKALRVGQGGSPQDGLPVSARRIYHTTPNDWFQAGVGMIRDALPAKAGGGLLDVVLLAESS